MRQHGIASIEGTRIVGAAQVRYQCRQLKPLFRTQPRHTPFDLGKTHGPKLNENPRTANSQFIDAANVQLCQELAHSSRSSLRNDGMKRPATNQSNLAGLKCT